MVTLSLTDDARIAVLDTGSGTPLRLDAGAVSALVARLAEMRAQMTPAFTGSYVSGVTPAIAGDNLLWEAMPDPARRGIDLAVQNPGLGWLSLRLSRAQVEDLVMAIAFAVAELSRPAPGSALPAPAPAAPPPSGSSAPVPFVPRRALTPAR